MTPELLLWPLSLLLLLTPSSVMFSQQIREKLRNPIRRRDEGIMPLLRCWLNWADLVRGALGGWLLGRVVHAYVSSQDDIATVYMIVQCAVLALGSLAQILWIDRPVRIIGPLFFLTGLTLAVSGPTIGGFALVLGITCALMLRRLSLGFVFVPCSLIAFAFLFHELSPTLLLNAFLFTLPTALAFLLGVGISYAQAPRRHCMPMVTRPGRASLSNPFLRIPPR